MRNSALEPPKTYLSNQNAYGHEACQGIELPLGAPTHKAT